MDRIQGERYPAPERIVVVAGAVSLRRENRIAACCAESSGPGAGHLLTGTGPD